MKQKCSVRGCRRNAKWAFESHVAIDPNADVWADLDMHLCQVHADLNERVFGVVPEKQDAGAE